MSYIFSVKNVYRCVYLPTRRIIGDSEGSGSSTGGGRSGNRADSHTLGRYNKFKFYNFLYIVQIFLNA